MRLVILAVLDAGREFSVEHQRALEVGDEILRPGLATIPGLVRLIIEKEMWTEFLLPHDGYQTWSSANFRAFLTDPRPKGCQASIPLLERMLRETEAWEDFERLTRGEVGNKGPKDESGRFTQPNRDKVPEWTETPSTVPLSQGLPRTRVRDYDREAPTGNSTSYAIRQLERGRKIDGEKLPPRHDLIEKVKAGEISIHKAMLEAGFRKPTLTVPLDPEAATRLIVKHFRGDDLTDLIHRLAQWAGIPLAEPADSVA